jgi:hypothetical protein
MDIISTYATTLVADRQQELRRHFPDARYRHDSSWLRRRLHRRAPRSAIDALSPR